MKYLLLLLIPTLSFAGSFHFLDRVTPVKETDFYFGITGKVLRTQKLPYTCGKENPESYLVRFEKQGEFGEADYCSKELRLK